jgi:mannose-6-phosphate isomerase
MRDAQAQAVQGDDDDDDDDFSIEESKPYAELWLGTHPNGMCSVTVVKKDNSDDNEDGGDDDDDDDIDMQETSSTTKHSLLDYVRSNPSMHCGSSTSAAEQQQQQQQQPVDLSFLLKVLSVRKVLSIQAHPDKQLAARLHAERPHDYADPNHKPEMAIALSEQVRAMCGFRPLSQIAQHLRDYPEFAALLGEATTAEIWALQKQQASLSSSPANNRETNPVDESAVRQVLKNMFHGYMQAPPNVIQKHVQDMVTRLRETMHEWNDVQKLILQLEEQFPNDCGIFAPLIFNLVELSCGEGLFIDANEPHAYVSGEILECMACSDNVVRAGLTPKLKDIPTLVNMLTYKTKSPNITSGNAVDACTIRYQPPVDDFCVEIIHVPAGVVYEVQAVDAPSVLLVLEGEASLQQQHCNNKKKISLDVSFGLAAFCSANTSYTVNAGPFGVRLARAFNNVYHHVDELS